MDTDEFDAFVLALEAGTVNAEFDGSSYVDTDDFTAFVPRLSVISSKIGGRRPSGPTP